jgi:hypothetical protein
MKKEVLIEKLNELPDNCDVYLFDYQKKENNAGLINAYSVEEIDSDEGNFGIISFE